MKNAKRITCIIIVVMLFALLVGCSPQAEDKTSEQTGAYSESAEIVSGAVATAADLGIDTTGAVKIRIDLEDYGVIEAELYPAVAPETVANFVNLVESGFYDGLTFHRVINGFMIQGGDPLGNGRGGADTTIKGEFTNNDFENPLSHKRGVLSMARGGTDNNSASSQFFIVHADSDFLDGDYAAFGLVTSGIEVVDQIAVDTPAEDENGTVKPSNQPVITSITIISE